MIDIARESGFLLIASLQQPSPEGVFNFNKSLLSLLDADEYESFQSMFESFLFEPLNNKTKYRLYSEVRKFFKHPIIEFSPINGGVYIYLDLRSTRTGI